MCSSPSRPVWANSSSRIRPARPAARAGAQRWEAARPALGALLLTVCLTGCSDEPLHEVAYGALESVARGLCSHASECRNVCPDGSTARGPDAYCPR